ncbi:MAG: ABC transporter ATP-binding protein [Erysipelotrichaceae bacterium]
MDNYCIELNHITKKFGNFTAVNDISLKLTPGKVYGIVGPNGAGKSTTMSLIMGTLKPTAGDGSVMGNPIGSIQALSHLGYSPEFTSFYSDMSCVEYLWYMATLAGLPDKEAASRANELIDRFELREHADKKVCKFSTGMKKKVSLAQAMIHNPSVLLLDEPTANLDPTSRMEILDIVRKMVNQDKQTVLISSHVLTELETVIDSVIMINHGVIVLNEDVQSAQRRFNNGIVIFNSSNNQLVLDKLADKYSYVVEGDEIKFSCDETEQLKRDLIRIIYENDLVINKIDQEKLSLDSLYKNALEGGQQ